MSKRLAIDIALLPPDNIMDKAIAINKQLIKQYSPKIVLNKYNCFAHITLSQCVIEAEKLDQVALILKKITTGFVPLKLKGRLDKEHNPWFKIENTKLLQKLHKKIMEETKKLTSYDAKPEYFSDAYVRQKSLDYVRKFLADSSYDNYYPHITLGLDNLTEMTPEISFTADRLVICHLGNYNTCKKILYETFLS